MYTRVCLLESFLSWGLLKCWLSLSEPGPETPQPLACFFEMHSFVNVRFKNQNLLMQQDSEWPNCILFFFFFLEPASFIWCVFTFSTQFLSGWWTVLRELTPKKVYFSLLGIIHWLNICSAIVKRCDWSCTNASNYLLSYIFEISFSLCVVLSSLLGLSVRIFLTLPQTPWCPFLDLLLFST